MAIEEAEIDSFPKLLLHHSKQRGERPALREKKRGIWRTMTWRELADEAAALAAALSAHGVKRGAHVAFVGDNRPRLYTAMCAAHWLGAVAVPFYQDATADEMVSPVQSAEITHIFAENQEQVDKLLEILPRCPTVRSIVYDKDRGMRHYNRPELVSYDALLQQGRELAAAKSSFLQDEAARGTGQDAAFLFFTSGTTGPAKGVVLTHGALIDRARVAATTENLKDTDVAMAYLPPGWIGQRFFQLRPADGRRLLRLLSRIVRDHARRYAGDGSDLLPGDAPGAGGAAHPGVDAHGGYGRLQSAPVPRRHGRGPSHRRRQDRLPERPPGRGRVQPADIRSVARRPRDEQFARGLYRRRRRRSRSGDVLRRPRNQPQAALWLD